MLSKEAQDLLLQFMIAFKDLDEVGLNPSTYQVDRYSITLDNLCTYIEELEGNKR